PALGDTELRRRRPAPGSSLPAAGERGPPADPALLLDRPRRRRAGDRGSAAVAERRGRETPARRPGTIPRRMALAQEADPVKTRLQPHEVTLSVVIPCYNEFHTLEQVIDAVRRAPLPRKEIILVDDGSTDGTRELIREKLEPLVERLGFAER